MQHRILYAAPDAYCAWPSMARAGNGDWLVAFTRTEQHIAPNGQCVLVRSADHGLTWSEPEIVWDTPLDNRPLGLTPLADGRVIAHVRSKPAAAIRAELRTLSHWIEPALFRRWMAYLDGLDAKQAEALQGVWMRVLEADGSTWGRPIPGPDLCHGGVQLPDGSLLAASFLADGGQTITLLKTETIGTPWQPIGRVALPPAEHARIRFSEPSLLRLPGGRLILMLRADPLAYDEASPLFLLWETWSDDGGAHWREPFPTALWGYPPHLTNLADGRVLCTYGYRKQPFGERACLSEDGVTWDPAREMVLRDDAPNADLGYPVSMEMEPGRVLTVYYQVNKPAVTPYPYCYAAPAGDKPAIVGTIWDVRYGAPARAIP